MGESSGTSARQAARQPCTSPPLGGRPWGDRGARGLGREERRPGSEHVGRSAPQSLHEHLLPTAPQNIPSEPRAVRDGEPRAEWQVASSRLGHRARGIVASAGPAPGGGSGPREGAPGLGVAAPRTSIPGPPRPPSPAGLPALPGAGGFLPRLPIRAMEPEAAGCAGPGHVGTGSPRRRRRRDSGQHGAHRGHVGVSLRPAVTDDVALMPQSQDPASRLAQAVGCGSVTQEPALLPPRP